MQNPIAKLLRMIGFLEIVAAFIIGLIMGNVDGYSTNWSVALLWWGMGFVSGILFLGFSEIIDLLNDIKRILTTTESDHSDITPSQSNSSSKGKYQIYKSIFSEQKDN